MKGSTALLVALMVLLVTLLIHVVATNPGIGRGVLWPDAADGWPVYRRSGGTFDREARLALRRARENRNPSPGDHLLAATVLARNVLAQEHRPEVDRRGAPTPAAVERSRRRRAAFDEARAHYMAALGGLGGPGGARPGAVDAPARIVDEAFEFAFGGVAGLFAGDPLLEAMVLGGGLPAELVMIPIGDDLFAVDGPLAAAAGARQEDVVRDRQRAAGEAAAEQGGARGAAVATYVGLAVRETDDPQNAHDPGVLACLRAVVARLREDQGPLGGVPALDRVVADLRANGPAYSEGRPPLVADAVAAAERAAAGERAVALDVTDEECLRRVWARADDPRNRAARAKLRQALFDNLVDCWEDGLGLGRKLVCVNGRVSRILATLVLLDWDARNWTVKKLEQFKNDVFERARRTIAAVAQRAAAGADPGLATAGRSYLAVTAEDAAAVGAVDPADAERLAAEMRDEIGLMVGAYLAELEAEAGVKDAIPAYLVASVTDEAKAAVTV